MASARVLLLTPVTPAATGYGLAMRAYRHATALSAFDLRTVVVPMSAASPVALIESRAGRTRAIGAVDEAARREAWMLLLRDPALRELVARADALPRLAVPPTAAIPLVVDALAAEAWRPDAVFVFRAHLALAGLAVASATGCACVVLDLDDDDAALARALADPDADALDRLVGAVAPHCRAVFAASPDECAALAARHAPARVDALPNAVTLPPEPLALRAAGEERAVVMVANHTYRPNAEGARWMADAVMPRVRAAYGPVRLDLVGLGAHYVADVADAYRAADVAVVPLHAGGGTRIKAIEALAFGRPVVATVVGVDGLALRAGRDVLVADDAEGFAAHVVGLLQDPRRRAELAAAGRAAVAPYSADRVDAQLREAMRRALLRSSGREATP